jgi:hypothetical protein
MPALRRVGHQHREIRRGAAQDFVEALIRSLDRGPLLRGLAQFAAGFYQSAQERQRPRFTRIAAHRNEQRRYLARRQPQVIGGSAGGEPVRRWIEGQHGASHFGVEAMITQQHLVVAAQFRARRSVAITMRAAHLE